VLGTELFAVITLAVIKERNYYPSPSEAKTNIYVFKFTRKYILNVILVSSLPHYLELSCPAVASRGEIGR
jgi:hypothetical protein